LRTIKDIGIKTIEPIKRKPQISLFRLFYFTVMTKVTLIQTEEQKALAYLQGKTVITANELALNYPETYVLEMKQHRELEGKPVQKHNDSIL
jgi:hypothetical protein